MVFRLLSFIQLFFSFSRGRRGEKDDFIGPEEKEWVGKWSLVPVSDEDDGMRPRSLRVGTRPIKFFGRCHGMCSLLRGSRGSLAWG